MSSAANLSVPEVLGMPKVVRDLLWTVTSPHMLSAEHYPVLPSEFGVSALKSKPVIEWINALAADPTPLLTFLQDVTKSKGRSLALGVYFSTLLEFWLRNCPHLKLQQMEIGKQIVSSTNRTVGQLKFLFRCNLPSRNGCVREQQDFHVESSVKFFLLNPIDRELDESSSSNGTQQKVDCIPLEQFVGPHLGENLAWRVQEVDRKLAACRGDSVRTWLRDNYSDNVRSHIVLRGYLFRPLSDFESTSETTIAHEWRFLPNPVNIKRNGNGGTGLGAPISLNPSIAVDHLRGWWTTDMETELPARVWANGQRGLGESRFVILPKLHWLSPVVGVEDTVTGSVAVGGDENLDIVQVESLSLEELVAFVREHFQKVAASAETNKNGGVAMPLLVAEIVRWPQGPEFADKSEPQRWIELSRGFILDPKCWDPTPLCHEPVRFRRTLCGKVEREYESRRPDGPCDGFIKPDIDELAAQEEQKRHKFANPDRVGPCELSHELAALLRNESPIFSHAELKRSTREFIAWRREQSASRAINEETSPLQVFSESAFLRSCFDALILDVNSTLESKLARRVGYLLLDVFEGSNQVANTELTEEPFSEEISNWVSLLLEVAREPTRWEFLNLVLRAVEVTLSYAHHNRWWVVEKQRLISLLDDLLGARKMRWNAVVVETIRVFRIGNFVTGPKRVERIEHSCKVQEAFIGFVEQHDWQSAEQLVILLQDQRMLQTLYKQLSLRNMTKALKRLRKNVKGASAVQSASDSLADGTLPLYPLGSPIDHENNRSIVDNDGFAFKWKYVDSPDLIEEVMQCLEEHEAAISSTEEYERAIVRSMLVGIDCEWRPQFLIDNHATNSSDKTESDTDDEDSNAEVEEGRRGLSVYQLSVGDVVYVIDVQVLGAAAAAPLEFIWRPSSCLLLIGFCVSSDIQRINESFPELMAETAHRTSPLLLELKKLALYRHVPANNWGLSRLYYTCIGEVMDKEQQCSDWGSRPLSYNQLVYAANDAYVVQCIALHLLADVYFGRPGDEHHCSIEHVKEYLKGFGAASSVNSLSWAMPFEGEPLGKQHVVAALRTLGVKTRFLKYDYSDMAKEGLVVKSIALRIRSKSQGIKYAYAVAVLALDRSIDIQALSALLEADAADISLADQETLLRVFGYSRGSLGPIGLREQQATRIIVDIHAQSESYLLCGAGTVGEVYAIPPDVLIKTVNAIVASISKTPQ